MPKEFTTCVVGDSRTWLTAGPASLTQVYDATKMRNTYENSMLIDEICFYAQPHGTVSGGGINVSGYAPLDILDGFQVFFNCRQMDLMPDPIDINLLCTDYQSKLERDIVPQASTKYAEAYRRWIPPEPIWLPPGDTLMCRITSRNSLIYDYTGDGVTIHVIYKGRITDAPMPRKVQLPYILAYDPQVSTSYQLPGQFVVPVKTLQNPNPQALRIQRIVARLRALRISGVNGNLLKLSRRDILRELPNLVSVRIRDSLQFDVTSESFIPFGMINDLQREAWTFSRELRGQGYLVVEFLRNADANYSLLATYPQLALICSREEGVM